MSRGALAALLFLLASAVAPAQTRLRLVGLERLYFTRIAAPDLSGDIAPLLPSILPHPEPAQTTPDGVEQDGRVTVRDIEIPVRSGRRRVWIREIVRASHPRISESWWALYDGGRRSDLWYFTPLPDRTEGKILGNYAFDGISMPARDVALFRIRGEMSRPGGAWSIVGKELRFAVDDSAITLARVRNLFGFFSSYDTDGSGSILGVSMEREVKGRFETREVDSLSERSVGACGFPVPSDDAVMLSWKRLEEVARCITRRRGAAIRYRDFKTRSFVERGGVSGDIDGK